MEMEPSQPVMELYTGTGTDGTEDNGDQNASDSDDEMIEEEMVSGY